MSKDLAHQARRPDLAPAIPARPALGRPALVIASGTLLSSLLGLARIAIINAVYGQSAGAGAFFAALKTPQGLADLLVGGAVGGALIPVLARYSQPSQRAELWRILIGLLALVSAVTGVAAVLLALLAPAFVPALNGGFAPADRALTVRLVQLLAPQLVGAGVVAVLSAALYALRRSFVPALAGGLLHLGIIGGAVLLAPRLGVAALAVGVLLGSAAQILFLSCFLFPCFRGFSWPSCSRPLRLWRAAHHPAIVQILRLYAPIAVGMLATLALQQIDQRLQSGTYDAATHQYGGPNVAALATATLLIQFPAGLVAATIAYAALPLLAQTRGQPSAFAALVWRGMRLGLALMVPILLLYLVWGDGIVALLFAHRAFTATDVARTAVALRGYAPQLPALAVEQVALAACSARGQARVPLITGLCGGAAYLAVALPLAPRLGMPALAAANSTLHIVNAFLLVGWLWRQQGSPLRGRSRGSLARSRRRSGR